MGKGFYLANVNTLFRLETLTATSSRVLCVYWNHCGTTHQCYNVAHAYKCQHCTFDHIASERC